MSEILKTKPIIKLFAQPWTNMDPFPATIRELLLPCMELHFNNFAMLGVGVGMIKLTKVLYKDTAGTNTMKNFNISMFYYLIYINNLLLRHLRQYQKVTFHFYMLALNSGLKDRNKCHFHKSNSNRIHNSMDYLKDGIFTPNRMLKDGL